MRMPVSYNKFNRNLSLRLLQAFISIPISSLDNVFGLDLGTFNFNILLVTFFCSCAIPYKKPLKFLLGVDTNFLSLSEILLLYSSCLKI